MIPEALPMNFRPAETLNIDSLMSPANKDLGRDYPFDVTATFAQLADEYGFDTDDYTVDTPDNYVLKMFRIKKKGQSARGKPVMLQHGLFSDSDTWILMKEESLAFVLADAGYDVWLGNNRGNKYSRKNTKIDVSQKAEFFDYSFFELGKYDAPT